ncbi:hypothetical protein OCEANICA350_12414 [Oceanicaulis sp. 350]|nr:hypothetical protein OCEANICA350_12414 [Oceanicaulis sp. 350]
MPTPKITSSIRSGSIPARSTAAFITWAASRSGAVALKAPRWALPIGVRAVETMTASRAMAGPFKGVRASPVSPYQFFYFFGSLMTQSRTGLNMALFMVDIINAINHTHAYSNNKSPGEDPYESQASTCDENAGERCCVRRSGRRRSRPGARGLRRRA